MADIAGHLETKLAAIGSYQSQFPPDKAHVYPRVRALAETVGLMTGCAAGEVLAGSRLPVTAEPLRFPATGAHPFLIARPLDATPLA